MRMTLGKRFELQDMLDKLVVDASASDDPLEAISAAVWLRDNLPQTLRDLVWVRVNDALAAGVDLDDALDAGGLGITGYYTTYPKALRRRGVTPAPRPFSPRRDRVRKIDAIRVPDEVRVRRATPRG